MEGFAKITTWCTFQPQPSKLSYISGNRTFLQGVTFRAQKLKQSTIKTFLLFPRNENFQRQAYETSYISGENLKVLKIKNMFFKHKRKKKVSDTFPCKEAKFCNLKYFLIILIKGFFSFYNIFFYTQPVSFFHLLRDICNINNHIVAFFHLQKDFEMFHELSFVIFLYFLNNIQLINFQTIL